jgi:hypothetical protein
MNCVWKLTCVLCKIYYCIIIMSCPACVVFIALKKEKKTGNSVAGAWNDDGKYKKRLFCVNLSVDKCYIIIKYYITVL